MTYIRNALKKKQMKYRNLGRSGLLVSEFSLGSWLTFGNQIADTVAEECMKLAYDNGINFFDNAEVYAQGKSEIVMGKILKKMAWNRDTYTVSSKVFWGGELPNQYGLSKKHIFEACEAALKRLQVDYLDMYFCHRPDKNTPMEETVRAMDILINQGKILYWGTSEWSAQEIQEAIGIARQYNLCPPTMEQPQYNMLTRARFEVEYYKLFRDYGMGSTIWSPLASGTLTGKYNKGIEKDNRFAMGEVEWIKDRTLTDDNLSKTAKLQEFSVKELGVPLHHLALAWCLKNPNVSTVILGASKVHQLKDNLTAIDVVEKLDDSVMLRIDEILENKPQMPKF